MKISTKGKYGLLFMFDLALHYHDGLIPLNVIASRQSISSKYLEQIVVKLNHGNLVKSVRGAHGGYTLTRLPHQITVGEILRVMEGSISPSQCVDDQNGCDNTNVCIAHFVWGKINDAVSAVVDNITLENLIMEYNSRGQLDYVI